MKWMIIIHMLDDSTTSLFCVGYAEQLESPTLWMIIIHFMGDLVNQAFALTYAHFDELLRVFQRLGRKRLSRQHAPDLSRPRGRIELFNRRDCPPVQLPLLHAVMMVRERRHLGQMRHA